MLYNTVLVLAKPQHESATGIPMSPCSRTSLPPPLEAVTEKYEKLNKFVCHPWAGVMLIFSVLFQIFNICAVKANTRITIVGMSWKHVEYHIGNESPVQVRYRILGAGALG